jgi:hypothetical protein
MQTCGYCGCRVLFGGRRSETQVFCSVRCLYRGRVLELSSEVPPDEVQQEVDDVFGGRCPHCGELGPVDVHKYYEVWSFMVVTRWSAGEQISCRSCATNRQLGALAFCIFCGWWGFPLGLVRTPIQITRNIAALCGGPNLLTPSAELRRAIRFRLGEQVLADRNKTSRKALLPGQPCVSRTA